MRGSDPRLPEHPGAAGQRGGGTPPLAARARAWTTADRRADGRLLALVRRRARPELYDWFAAQRPTRRTGILSNSGPGAREAERCWGFEAITDDIVYSHEVGLMKPDPQIYCADRAAARGTAFRGGLPGRRRGPRGGRAGARRPRRRAHVDARVDPGGRAHHRRGGGAPVSIDDLPEGPCASGRCCGTSTPPPRPSGSRPPTPPRSWSTAGARPAPAPGPSPRTATTTRWSRSPACPSRHPHAVHRATSTASRSGRRRPGRSPSSRPR